MSDTCFLLSVYLFVYSLQITVPSDTDEVPELPEPEGSILKNHLKQVCIGFWILYMH